LESRNQAAKQKLAIKRGESEGERAERVRKQRAIVKQRTINEQERRGSRNRENAGTMKRRGAECEEAEI
jgi:hypothetical protein